MTKEILTLPRFGGNKVKPHFFNYKIPVHTIWVSSTHWLNDIVSDFFVNLFISSLSPFGMNIAPEVFVEAALLSEENSG